MTKVNQLLEKALSTSSEDEAISCLRLARKRHTGETVSVSPDSSTNTTKVSDGINWKIEAHKYYDIAIERDRLLSESRKRADYFMKEMTQAQIDRNMYHTLYLDAHSTKNLWRNAFIGSLVLSGILATVAYIFMVSQ